MFWSYFSRKSQGNKKSENELELGYIEGLILTRSTEFQGFVSGLLTFEHVFCSKILCNSFILIGHYVFFFFDMVIMFFVGGTIVIWIRFELSCNIDMCFHIDTNVRWVLFIYAEACKGI